jgi:hypothetical protein
MAFCTPEIPGIDASTQGSGIRGVKDYAASSLNIIMLAITARPSLNNTRILIPPASS